MPKPSAGLLMYRVRDSLVEVLLVHPGGPFWKKRDEGAWTIPKGQVMEGEELLQAACREFQEETGVKPTGPFAILPAIRQKAGKVVHAWCFEGDCDPRVCTSNTFMMEWPPRSGVQAEFPEIDCAEFFTLPAAEKKILESQIPLLHARRGHLSKAGHGNVSKDLTVKPD